MAATAQGFPWDAFASHPRLGCTSQQATVLRTLENLYAEQERHQDPLLSALLVEQLGFYLRRLLQKGRGNGVASGWRCASNCCSKRR